MSVRILKPELHDYAHHACFLRFICADAANPLASMTLASAKTDMYVGWLFHYLLPTWSRDLKIPSGNENRASGKVSGGFSSLLNYQLQMRSQLMLSWTDAANSSLMCHTANASPWNHGRNSAFVVNPVVYFGVWKGRFCDHIIKIIAVHFHLTIFHSVCEFDVLRPGGGFVSCRTILSATPCVTRAATGELGFHVLRRPSRRRSSAFTAVLQESRSLKPVSDRKQAKYGSAATIPTRE